MMEHLTKRGEEQAGPGMQLPLTGLACVSRIYTDLAVIDVTAAGLRAVETDRRAGVRRTGEVPGVPIVPPTWREAMEGFRDSWRLGLDHLQLGTRPTAPGPARCCSRMGRRRQLPRSVVPKPRLRRLTGSLPLNPAVGRSRRSGRGWATAGHAREGRRPRLPLLSSDVDRGAPDLRTSHQDARRPRRRHDGRADVFAADGWSRYQRT